jgi:hypothetical protein
MPEHRKTRRLEHQRVLKLGRQKEGHQEVRKPELLGHRRLGRKEGRGGKREEAVAALVSS